jgi:hypothetical protein
MGTWSSDILGGDGPLDTLCTIEDLIGYDNDDGGVYRIFARTNASADDARQVRSHLEANEAKVIAGNPKYPWDDESWPVIAAVYLASGATMPDQIRDQALAACKEEITDLSTVNSMGWNTTAERIAVLEKHILDIQAHEPGKITNIGHVGLFEAIAIP